MQRKKKTNFFSTASSLSTANNKPKQFQREIRRNICTRRRYNVVRYKPVELTNNNNNEKIRKIIQYVYTFILILLFSCVVLFYIKCVHYMHTRKQTNKHLHFIWMGQIFLFVFHTFFYNYFTSEHLLRCAAPTFLQKIFALRTNVCLTLHLHFIFRMHASPRQLLQTQTQRTTSRTNRDKQ